jgi:HEAT repeat protein
MLACALGGAAWAESTPALRAALNGTDDDKAAEAARALGESSDPKALEALLDGLAVGAEPAVQAAMLGALAGKKDARAVDVLRHFARNRNPELRKKALVALASLADARAVAPLAEALSDPVEEVRAAAAKALGDRRERSAEPRLIKLFKHHDAAAGTALAQLATPELAHRLTEMQGEVPDALLCNTIGDILKRGDFGPEPIRVELVRALSKVPGMDSTTVLVEYVAATEKDKQRPSRIEAQKLVEQRSSR